MSSSFFHYKRWMFGLIESKKIENLNELNQILEKYDINLDVNYFNCLAFLKMCGFAFACGNFN